jgi:hypothetical protein
MMAVFFNDPKRNGDSLADWADRAGCRHWRRRWKFVSTIT